MRHSMPCSCCVLQPPVAQLSPTLLTAADPDTVHRHKNAQQHNHRQVARSACRPVHGSLHFGLAPGLARCYGAVQSSRSEACKPERPAAVCHPPTRSQR